MKIYALLATTIGSAHGWLVRSPHPFLTTHPSRRSPSALDMAAVGIFYGTSTGSTQEVADAIYEAFGSEVAAEPVDVDTLDANGEALASAFGQHSSLIVGTPTWNTGAESERSGTGWDELYYNQLPSIQQTLKNKKVAVFGLGDQVSYSENYADATGEMFDVFEGLGCQMLGAWPQDGYEHDDSKSIRGDKFCGLLLDMVNQEELTEERVQKWVEQLKSEGILESGSATVNGDVATGVAAAADPSEPVNQEVLKSQLEENSELLEESIQSHSTGGFTPHHNPVKGTTMWTSPDGRQSFVTALEPTTETKKYAP